MQAYLHTNLTLLLIKYTLDINNQSVTALQLQTTQSHQDDDDDDVCHVWLSGTKKRAIDHVTLYSKSNKKRYCYYYVAHSFFAHFYSDAMKEGKNCT